MNIELNINDIIIIIRALEKVDPTFLFTVELQKSLRKLIEEAKNQNESKKE